MPRAVEVVAHDERCDFAASESDASAREFAFFEAASAGVGNSDRDMAAKDHSRDVPQVMTSRSRNSNQPPHAVDLSVFAVLSDFFWLPIACPARCQSGHNGHTSSVQAQNSKTRLRYSGALFRGSLNRSKECFSQASVPGMEPEGEVQISACETHIRGDACRRENSLKFCHIVLVVTK